MSNSKSIYSDYAKGVFLLFVAIGLPLFYYATVALQTEQAKDTMGSLTMRANHIYQILEHDTFAKLKALEHAARQISDVPANELNRAEFENSIKDIPGIVWAGFAGLDGKVKYATGGMLEGKDISHRPWFSEGLVGPAVADKHEALLLASMLPARSQPYKFIDMSVPVTTRDGKLLGVAALHMDWVWYEQQFPYLLGLKPEGSDITYLVTGQDGQIRLSDFGAGQTEDNLKPMLEEMKLPAQAQKNYWVTQATPANESYLTKLGWRVTVLQPKTHGFAYQTMGGLLALLGLAAGFLAISLFSWFRFRTFSRQVASHLAALEAEDSTSLASAEQALTRELQPVMRSIRVLLGRAASKAKELKIQYEKSENNYLQIDGLIRQAPVAMAMFDQDMNYLVCSDLWRKSYLKGLENPRGQNHYELVPNIPDAWKKYYREGLAGKSIHKENDHWVLDSGKSVWLNWVIEPWFAIDGTVGGIIILTEDRTDEILAKMALKHSEERFELAMQGTSDGLYDWNIVNNELYYSPRYKQMLGYRDNELPNTFEAWESLLHPLEKQAALDEVNRIIFRSQNSSWQLNFRMKHKKGYWVPILSRGTILRDAQARPIRVVGTHLDRTEIDALNKELEQARITALTEIRSNEAKSRFLATVSHEIRNPMNAIAGFARLISEETQSPTVKGYSQLLTDTTESLRMILNDILDFAKMDADKLEIVNAPFDLLAMVHSVGQAAKIQCDQKGVEFKLLHNVDGAPRVFSDATRLRQICQNLLSNAVKFTAQGSVTLSLTLAPRDRGGRSDVCIKVTDSGIGIGEDKLKNLFTPFSQVHDQLHTNYGGTGLGLSIVKGLAAALGGTIEVKSELGKGTTFTVNLVLEQLKDMPAVEAADKGELLCPEGPKSVMVVDDMPVNTKIIEAFLKKRGHQVDTLCDSSKAIHLLKSKAYDVAILDLNMPGLNGIEMAQLVRESDSASRNCQLICMTGNVLSETVTEAMLAGFDNFCSKPVDFDNLERLVCYSRASSDRLSEVGITGE